MKLTRLKNRDEVKLTTCLSRVEEGGKEGRREKGVGKRKRGCVVLCVVSKEKKKKW